MLAAVRIGRDDLWWSRSVLVVCCGVVSVFSSFTFASL
ncbi:hypothetical protein A2U01_0083093, partial [Trifolium medium]|nr:hypothetical protein [Trifolium medium]